ncbi:MAG: hypothetical protein K0R34_3431 [Herbinix sp.]|nr:hypothetical protein [Herbinix sp.]
MNKPISELTSKVERFSYAGYFLGHNIFYPLITILYCSVSDYLAPKESPSLRIPLLQRSLALSKEHPEAFSLHTLAIRPIMLRLLRPWMEYS